MPEYDDRALFEKLVLDGFQAGLSWITILRKRDNFRRAFDGFEPAKIARYTPRKVEKLMQGPVADALTHVGQLAMLRRIAGAPSRSENYSVAEIIAGRTGAQQTVAGREFD